MGSSGISDTISIYNSYTDVEVRGKHVGGLIGSIGTTGGWIVSSYARGSIEGDGSRYSLVGGLVGIVSRGIIGNSYAEVAVSQGTSLALIAGSFHGTLWKSYGVGLVSGAGANIKLGGLVEHALIDDGAVRLSNAFWDELTTGQENSDGADRTSTMTGDLATANMQVACAAGAGTGICVLGSGFIFAKNAYPKVKKCTGACGTDNPIFGTELLGGQ